MINVTGPVAKSKLLPLSPAICTRLIIFSCASFLLLRGVSCRPRARLSLAACGCRSAHSSHSPSPCCHASGTACANAASIRNQSPPSLHRSSSVVLLVVLFLRVSLLFVVSFPCQSLPNPSG